MSDQLLKVSGQLLQPIRNRVSSKKWAVQSASSCSGERPGRERGNIISHLLTVESKKHRRWGYHQGRAHATTHANALLPRFVTGPFNGAYPSRFPIFTPDTVQGCSDDSVGCRSFATVSKPGPFSTIPWWRGNEFRRRNFSYLSDIT